VENQLFQLRKRKPKQSQSNFVSDAIEVTVIALLIFKIICSNCIYARGNALFASQNSLRLVFLIKDRIILRLQLMFYPSCLTHFKSNILVLQSCSPEKWEV